MAFALQLRKKHGKTSVRVAVECQLAKNTQISITPYGFIHIDSKVVPKGN